MTEERPSPWSGRSHAELAELARELLLAGQLIDRAGMPHVIARLGREEMGEVAIAEWMAASPVYTRRMQRLLGFEGDTVEVIFKGMQLDVGAPPEFMDFRYELTDDHHGAFHLDHCGALMDVEPMGDAYVQTMCHDIEDPTFDATAAATNPRARMRPIHRPPRIPAGREPHCAWTVTIEPDADPLPFPAQAEALSTSLAAATPLATAPDDLADDDGANDYAGPLDPDLVMERFSSAALAAILDEVCLQGHLLSRGFLVDLAERIGGPDAAAIGSHQLTGVAGLVAKRLAAALGAGPDLAGVAAVLAVHPMGLPRAYVELTVEALEALEVGGAVRASVADGHGLATLGGDQAGASAGDDHALHGDDPASVVRVPASVGPDIGGVIGALRVALKECPATIESDGLTWPAILASGSDAGLQAAVQCIAPTALVERVEAHSGEAGAWTVRLDPDAPPTAQPDDVTLAGFSTGATFAFERRGTPVTLTRSGRRSPTDASVAKRPTPVAKPTPPNSRSSHDRLSP